ncbi:helix-turn-helix domain-containing protein [Paracoccus sp. MBLB3053]|uniref:Helix-turn-helix domain-containing protein n=1 Tax=Paracoccus aurantius TaxID=3073814 RepID=A0ABU2HVM1_9RHOB|nr:helix-turn-helix domain-containing protein [Paracoccus sp. MBLB3053]MDS9469090.1 helix-turn-helix domain-containing protein [Paracoccus sp. MBLB3053]
MTRTSATTIPHYYLYGDQDRDVELDFLHVEPILDRSGPHGWRIRPHAHPDHLQIMLIHHGGGVLSYEDQRRQIPVPAVLILPAGCVHQFEFDAGTDGYVVTAALGWLNAATAADPALAETVTRPAVLALEGSGVDVSSTIETFDWLLREFVWSAPGRRSAIMGLFLRLLVIVLRLGISHRDSGPAPGDRDQDLLIRYRGLMERHYRNQRSPSFYARQLAVTTARLNAACKLKAGRTASEILHERILLEAKRCLLYTENSVTQIAHMTGFDDPAYFNRFFARRTGVSPGVYRKQGGTDG